MAVPAPSPASTTRSKPSSSSAARASALLTPQSAAPGSSGVRRVRRPRLHAADEGAGHLSQDRAGQTDRAGWQWIEATDDNPADGLISELTIDLARDGNGTMLTLTHAGLPDQEQVDSHTHGWAEALDKLERLLTAYGRLAPKRCCVRF
jgi:Activator of Hsp90 ATPase homolog 1-like protein